jgi:hypothetical protein
MGGACSTGGKDEKHKTLVGRPEERDHWEVLAVDGNIMLEWIVGR